MPHPADRQSRPAGVQAALPLMMAIAVATSPAHSTTPPQLVAADSLTPDACFSLGSAECTSDDDQWQSACSDWHRQNSPEKTTHIVVRDEQAPGLTAFLGASASVTAEYFDCGHDGRPGENSEAWLSLQEQEKKREQWLGALEASRAHGTGQWQVTSANNTVSLALPASRASDTNGASYRLTLQCSARSLAVHLRWASAMDTEEMQIIERYGTSAPRSRVWSIVDDGLGAAHPRPDEALWQLFTADKYAVRTMPYNGTPSTAFFEPAGLAGAVEPYLAQCGMQAMLATAP